MSGFPRRVTLGRSGLQVSPLGLGASYGVPYEACRAAFDAGVNYFFWGSVRSIGMGLAIRELAVSHRAQLVIVVQCYVRDPRKIAQSLELALRKGKLDYADALLLGWHDERPSAAVVDAAYALVEQGRCRHLGISSHNRPLFVELATDARFDVFHVRYNAAHRGAEREVFPLLPAQAPGIVSFTNTRWGDLLRAQNMPRGMAPPSAADCYRFALSSPHVQVAISGPKDLAQTREALSVLDLGPLDEPALQRMRRIGDHVHGVRSFSALFT